MFVIAGGVFLVILLYMIGRKENLFGSTFLLKARFGHVQGLMPGNNVRFSGIQVGTVKSVYILDDTTIEVVMRLETKMKKHLRKNAVASIGTEGFIGNKVVNILPSKDPAPAVDANDILASRRSVETDDMLRTLERTNADIGQVAADLKITIGRLKQSTAVWRLLNDESLPANLSASLRSIRSASLQTENMTMTLNEIVAGIQQGKGSLGQLLTDTSISVELQETLARIKTIGDNAEKLANEINNAVARIDQEVNNGKGTLHAVLKDSSLAISLAASLKNIESGTASFSQNMEALKHNILFRGYFRKLERQQKKAN